MGRSRERKFRCAYVTQNSLPEEAASPTAPAPSEAALPTAPAPSDKAPPVASSAADAAPWAPDATAPAPSSAALKPVHRVKVQAIDQDVSPSRFNFRLRAKRLAREHDLWHEKSRVLGCRV